MIRLQVLLTLCIMLHYSVLRRVHNIRNWSRRLNAHWRVRCIASWRIHVVYCEPDATARCDESLHDARIELEYIQAFFSDATRRVTYIVNPPLQ